MNIYFSGIGGVGIGPLAEIALDAGHSVQGSDPLESPMTLRLAQRGVAIDTTQQGEFLQASHAGEPIEWFVHSSALPDTHPELVTAKALGIKTSKRDEFLAFILQDTGLKLIAVAGTHGKTSTSAMLVWALQQLHIPVSYSVGSTLSFGPAGKYDPDSKYFVYECDEFDRNFLFFHPYLSLITSIDYDHPDTYPTPEEYTAAFGQFVDQSEGTIMWRHDGTNMHPQNSWVLEDNETAAIKLPGQHVRQNATLVLKAIERLGIPGDHMSAVESFPGADRRFERIAYNLYSDYGHHPTEIAATLQMARELSDHVVLVYQPHQNVRQHEIQSLYTDCFEAAETVYWLPTYLSREDPDLPVLTFSDLTKHLTNPQNVHPADLDDGLWGNVHKARDENKLVLFMGAGSIDGWLRERWATPHIANILVIDTDGNFIMQHRDDKPDISNPGLVTAFGGRAEPYEQSLLQAAARELHEETNLQFAITDLQLFKLYAKTLETHGEKSYVAIYILPDVDCSELEVFEGQGYEVVQPANIDDYKLSILARTVISEYTNPNLL